MKDSVSVSVVPSNPAASLLHEAAGEALKQLTAARPIPDEAIHEARKSLKKARAALRLLRDGLSDTAYRRENARLRDAGRLLTPLRDAKSLIDALDSLQKQYASKLPDSGLAPLHKILHANLVEAHRHFHPGTTHGSAELNNCVKLIKNSLAMAKRQKIRSIEPVHIGSGLRRIYRKGRKARAEARADPTTERLHEWRKQVKYLLNATDGLRSMGSNGNGVKKMLKRADRLADLLGNDQELGMLAREIDRVNQASASAGAVMIKTLHRFIDRRRAKLQKRAFKSGTKLYDHKPRQFAKRACAHVCAAPC
jgi:CHAD domain-containing protein